MFWNFKSVITENECCAGDAKTSKGEEIFLERPFLFGQPRRYKCPDVWKVIEGASVCRTGGP